MLPDQSPEAVQEVALVEVQERVAELLYDIVIGPSEPLALISTVGIGTPTVTVTLSSRAKLPLSAITLAV